MITPEELIQDLIDFYGYEVDLSYAINYIDIVGQYAEFPEVPLTASFFRFLSC